MNTSLAALINRLPEETAPLFLRWISGREVTVKLVKARATKRGDFTPPHKGRQSAITLNKDLGSYSLAVTLTHEIAHLYVWERYKRSAKPHGVQWKQCFAQMLTELAQIESLPISFRKAIKLHAKRPKASSIRDLNLYRTLCALDGAKELWLESLNDGDEFLINGRRFRRERRRRTRCLCVEVATGQQYLVSLAASVSPID